MKFWVYALAVALGAMLIVICIRQAEKYEFAHKTTELVVAILSSRNHFGERDLIRKTWLNGSYMGNHTNRFKAWFVVGNQSCPMPPYCRKNAYSCDFWLSNYSDIDDSFTTSLEGPTRSQDAETYYQGYSFQVNHPVILLQLGIYKNLLPAEKSVTISLLDVQTKETIVSVTLSLDYFHTESFGFLYQVINPYILPKHFVGLLLVEGPLHGEFKKTQLWNSNNGILTFTKIYSSSDDLKSIAFDSSLNCAPSMLVKVSDWNSLRTRNTFCQSDFYTYNRELAKVDKELLKEQEQWNDIIFVNAVDTYRNLPKKLLLFQKWLVQTHNFLYLLKTDDDVIVDIARVLNKLNEKDFERSKYWIWSKFRSRWPVNYIGKWADTDYRSPIYPLFPCGSGYVISEKVAYWLTKNIDELYCYQGEDVSMGIWLSAVNPSYFEDEKWACGDDDKCSAESYNRAELREEKILEAWNDKLMCGNICSCKNETAKQEDT